MEIETQDTQNKSEKIKIGTAFDIDEIDDGDGSMDNIDDAPLKPKTGCDECGKIIAFKERTYFKGKYRCHMCMMKTEGFKSSNSLGNTFFPPNKIRIREALDKIYTAKRFTNKLTGQITCSPIFFPDSMLNRFLKIIPVDDFGIPLSDEVVKEINGKRQVNIKRKSKISLDVIKNRIFVSKPVGMNIPSIMAGRKFKICLVDKTGVPLTIEQIRELERIDTPLSEEESLEACLSLLDEEQEKANESINEVIWRKNTNVPPIVVNSQSWKWKKKMNGEAK